MKNKTRLKQIEIGGGEARYWNAFLRTGVQCGDWQVSVERVSLIADILKNSGHCNCVYGDKYYVMIKYSQWS